jgi:hypothetical protein
MRALAAWCFEVVQQLLSLLGPIDNPPFMIQGVTLKGMAHPRRGSNPRPHDIIRNRLSTMVGIKPQSINVQLLLKVVRSADWATRAHLLYQKLVPWTKQHVTSYQLFYNITPMIIHLWLFGCPSITNSTPSPMPNEIIPLKMPLVTRA